MKSVQQNRINRIVLLLLGLALVCSPAPTALAGDELPWFSLPSVVDGKMVSSEDFKGKTLLINFFATWCPPCRQEIPALIELQKQYAASGFSVIALSMDERGPQVVQKLVAKEGINYPVVMADATVVRDFGGITGIPTSFLVDRQGKIVKRYPGFAPHSLLEKDIRSFL